MTFGASIGIALALGLVLVLLGLSLRLLQRLAPGSMRGRGRIPMEVVQRMSLGPKQGIAVVRIGERVVAVSVGEGGMRRLFELGDDEAAAVIASSPLEARNASDANVAPATHPTSNVARVANGSASKVDFRAALHGALRNAGLGSLLALALLIGATRASAQAPVPATLVRAATSNVAPVGGNLSLVRAPGAQLPQSTNPAANAAASALVNAAANGARSAGPLTLQRPATPAQGTAAPNAANANAAAIANAAVRALNGQAPAPANAPRGVAAAANAAAKQAASSTPGVASGAALAVQKLAPQMDLRVGSDNANGGLRMSGTVGIVIMMGLLTLLPTLLLMMTSFTRILIVLHFLRQALGTQNAPPAQLVAAIALLLTGFVMAPTLTELNRDALQPWLGGQIEQGEMLERGAKPFKAFMLRQTREHDLQVFVELSKGPRPASAQDVPMVTLMSAFVTSELRTAFQIGFALFLPFIIIDVVVSSVLMSMGMFMLPPAMISLPFKLLLFVLVDGWTLIVQSLVASFR